MSLETGRHGAQVSQAVRRSVGDGVHGSALSAHLQKVSRRASRRLSLRYNARGLAADRQGFQGFPGPGLLGSEVLPRVMGRAAWHGYELGHVPRFH